MAVSCEPGCLPLIACTDKNYKFSTAFDQDALFTHHCRGQGSHYNTRHETPVLYRGDGMSVHYNFSGFYCGNCCFCALHSGFGHGVFSQMGCSNCVRKEVLREEFAKLIAKRASSSFAVVSWVSHGWRALPSVVIDYILVFALGLENCGGKVTVRDGCVTVYD